MSPEVTPLFTQAPSSPWGFWKKFSFRFAALYFLLYITSRHVMNWWKPLVNLLAEHVLHLNTPVTLTVTGSGDGTYYYVQLLGILLTALLGTVVWTVLDYKPKNYDTLLYWLLVVVRYTLATAMVSYGFAKLYKTQFPSPMPYSLFLPMGQSSPMGLVWKFMGYSAGYNLFTGFAEVLGGLFLFFRRTATFGALLSFGVMANIVALNFFYDVPVKLYSSHLLLMALFVAAPDFKRLFSFFFLNKTVEAARLAPVLSKKWMKVTRFWLKLTLVSFIWYKAFANGYNTIKRYGDAAPKFSLYGAYQVVDFIRNGDTIPPLTTDTTRWKLLTVNHHQFLSAHLMNDTVRVLRVKTDSTQKTFTWTSSKDSTQTSQLYYHQPDSNLLTLTGHLHHDSVKIHLRKIDLQQLPLLRRGFHWVNEYPYNR